VRGAAGTFGLKVAEAGATFVLNVVLARLLGAEGFGLFALAVAWASLLTVPSLVGHENLTIRFVATYSRQAASGLLHGFLRHALTLVSLASVTLAGLGLLLNLWLAEGPTARFAVFAAALAFVPVLALIRVTQAGLRGLRHVATGYAPELAILPLGMFGLIGAALMLGVPMTPLLAVIIQLAAGIIALLVGLGLLRKYVPAQVWAAAPETLRSEWMRGAWPLLFIGGTQVVNRQADIIMIGAFVGDAAAGIYAVATRSAGLIGFVLFSVNAALAPLIARVYADRDFAALQRIATRSARAVLLFSLPVTAFFILFGSFFLQLFGPEFAPASAPLAVLSVGQFVNASMGSVALMLTMTGHEHFAARGFGLGAASNLLLNAVLIPPFGIVGAAVATSTSLVVWNVMLAIYVYRLLGLHSTALGVIRLRRRSNA
jgi:O-antigen/teichoic acid export membrane protein